MKNKIFDLNKFADDTFGLNAPYSPPGQTPDPLRPAASPVNNINLANCSVLISTGFIQIETPEGYYFTVPITPEIRKNIERELQ